MLRLATLSAPVKIGHFGSDENAACPGAPVSGKVTALKYAVGEVVEEAALVFSVEAGEAAKDKAFEEKAHDLDDIALT